MKRLNLFLCTASVHRLGISHFHCLSCPAIYMPARINPWMTGNANLRYSAAPQSSSKEETIGWYGDEGRHLRVSVWWDFENCSVPVGVNVYKIAPRILAALRTSGVKGPITIHAFGDVVQLSRSSQEALAASGIYLSHVPRGGKDSADRALLVDLVLWASQNPPPAHLFLISGDGDFSSILHRLRMRNYNILLAKTETSSTALCNAASIVWQWNSLVKGKGLLGKQFNHPPDGIPGSWYGEPIGPVEDAFRDIKFEPSSNTVPGRSEGFETESNQESDGKPQQIPKTVTTQISDILHSYPEGLNITDLSEIVRNDIKVEKDYFGYKKFLRFLLAMPDILKLGRHISTDGKTCIYYAYPIKNKSKTKTKKLRIESADGCKEWDKRDEQVETTGKLSSSLPKVNSKEHVVGNESTMFAQVKETNAAAGTGQSNDSQDQTSKTQKSFIDRVLGNWFGIEFVNDSGKVHGSKIGEIKQVGRDADDGNSRSDSAGLRRNLNAKYQNNPDKGCNMSPESRFSFRQWLFRSPSYNSSSSEVGVECELKGKCKGNSKKSNSSRTQILSWFSQNWKDWLPALKGNAGQTSPCHADAVGRQNKFVDSEGNTSDHHVLSQLEDDHIFSKPEFWNEVKSYLQSNRGSAIVSEAKSRKDMINMLQKEGPLLLCNLGQNNLHHLINVLVEDKKWLEEGSQKFPFRLNIPGKNNNSHPASTNKVESLSSTFQKCMPEPKGKNTSLKKEKELKSVNNYLHDKNVGRENGAIQCPNFDMLKEWLITVYKDHGNISITKLEALFNQEFNRKLDSKSYGFSKVEDLIASCSDEISMVALYNRKEMSRTEVINDCQELLDEVLCNNPLGYQISSFKSSFFQRYGYTLDQRMLGYAKLSSFLKAMAKVEVQYNVIYSSGNYLKSENDKNKTSDSNLEQSCKELEGTTDKDTGTEEMTQMTRQIDNLEHSNKMQEGRTLEDTVERTDIERRRPTYDLEQISEERCGRPFKGPGIEKKIHTEERKPCSHNFTSEGILKSVDTVNDEEANWEELGPIVVQRYEEIVSSSTEQSLQNNWSPDDASQMQLQKGIDKSSLQSCGDSDTLVFDAECTRPTEGSRAVEGHRIIQSGENNFSLQTLDVPCKDTKKSSLQKQPCEKLDGLVDCSVCDDDLNSSHFLTAELSRSSLTMRNFEKEMKNRKRRVAFQETATNSNDDAAESLLESILSTLKKTTSVKLDQRSP